MEHCPTFKSGEKVTIASRSIALLLQDLSKFYMAESLRLSIVEGHEECGSHFLRRQAEDVAELSNILYDAKDFIDLGVMR